LLAENLIYEENNYPNNGAFSKIIVKFASTFGGEIPEVAKGIISFSSLSLNRQNSETSKN
jgi:hypothetical protein